MYAKMILDTEGQTEERLFPISECNRVASTKGPLPRLLLHRIEGPVLILDIDMNRPGITVYIENDTGATLDVFRGQERTNAVMSRPKDDDSDDRDIR